MADLVSVEPFVSVTPAASERIRNLLEQKELSEHGLRVFVSGGGCSGMQYGMAFEGNPQENDFVMDFDGVRIIVDAVSRGYLEGASIDFIDNLMGGGFSIDNPNAASSCGCGHSFRTSEGEAAGDQGSACGTCG